MRKPQTDRHDSAARGPFGATTRPGAVPDSRSSAGGTARSGFAGKRGHEQGHEHGHKPGRQPRLKPRADRGEEYSDATARLAALRRSQMVVEFDMDGIVLDANENFLGATGYTLDEIRGRHHRIFVDQECDQQYGGSAAEYAEFWARLNRGEYQAGEYRLFGKDRRELWLQASYNPVLDRSGRPVAVVAYATDATASKQAQNFIADFAGRIAQGVIPPKITENFAGGFDRVRDSMNACIDALSGLVETNAVLQRMAVNDYTRRVQSPCPGIFGEAAKAANTTASHIQVLVKVLGEAARGDVSYLPRLKAVAPKSEHDELTPSTIRLLEALFALCADAEALAAAVREGRIGARAAIDRHRGDFRKIVEGMNRTLDLMTGPLKVASESGAALASSSEALAAVSQQMAGNAEATAVQADVVSAASQEISRNVAAVASAAEEMQASIREIARNASESARVAGNAVSVTRSANETVNKLGESSQEIGNVLKVITSIAQQTNLLALNATIEAARAGEAGKGFAVVANEVKELARQTAKATEDIGCKIDNIQANTKGAVGAIEEIGSVIEQVNDIASSIATAVEEQTVTTNEIGRSVTEASKGVENIAQHIGGVAAAAKSTTEGAGHTQKASQELSRMAAQLQTAIARFSF